MGGLATTEAAGFVAVAEVVRAVGLKGEFRLEPTLDWHPGLLGTPYLIWRSGEACEVEGWRAHGQGAVVRVAGCTTLEAARRRVGDEVGFLRSRYAEPGFPKPPEGLPFRYLGRPVVTAAGAPVGTVTEVRRYARQLLLVIARPAAAPALVPAVAPLLRPAPGLEGDLVIDPPAGLIDGEAAVADGA